MKILKCDNCGAEDSPEEPFSVNDAKVDEDVRMRVTRRGRAYEQERKWIHEFHLDDLCRKCLTAQLDLITKAVHRG
jgi:hypothetical protein